jgi:hypothetical protein
MRPSIYRMEKIVRSLFACIVLVLGLMLIPGPAWAQTTHYPAGVEGIKGASLPPPGYYIRDYNYTYFSDSFKEGPPAFDIFANVQAPRLIWITGQKVLGGYYGMDVIVPSVYQDLDMTGFRGSDFSMGDLFVEPITLSWHPKQADFSFGYGFWAPTADYRPTDPVAPGKGFWTQMLTAGVTVYPDKAKTWSLSALHRYEFNQKRSDTGMTPGQYWTLEWGLAKSVSKTIELGVVGYYQAQTTLASGLGASKIKDSVAAIGPEITLVCPKLGVATSIRYLREAGASNRPEGNTFNIILTKRLGPKPH